MKTDSLTISHLAKQADVNRETVRFYERRGLLTKPPRSASGYRLFPSEAARRLRFIRRAQERYGIRSVPAVAIDGKLASCCAGRGPDEQVLRSALA